MKRKTWKSILCALLIVLTLMAPVSASAATTARIMKVNGSWVNLRSSGQNGYVVKNLRKGQKVLYWGVKNGEMYKVMLSDLKTTGYVHKDYLTTYGAFKLNQLYKTTASTKTYNLSGKSNGTLGKGKFVAIYQTKGQWGYGKTMSGKTVVVNRGNLVKAF